MSVPATGAWPGRTASASAEVTEFSAAQIGQVYDFPAGLDGTGVCIGIIELGGGYSQQDLDTSSLPPAGHAQRRRRQRRRRDQRLRHPSGADGEVELDIEVAGSIAPGATIAVYFAPNSEQGFIDAIHGGPSTRRTTRRSCPSAGGQQRIRMDPAGLSGMDTAFQQAASASMTVLAAAGDNGSNDNVFDGQAHCDFPASDPYVIACGGTTLQVSGDEAVVRSWNSP